MDRVIEYDTEKELFALASMVLSIPQSFALKAEAFTLFPGMGETWRIKHAIDTWERSEHRAKFLLIAGMNLGEKTAINVGIDVLKQFGLVNTKNVIVRAHAEHTKDQSEWVCQQVKKFSISSLALFASPYHTTRAYLTLVKALIRERIVIPVSPMPTVISPSMIIPETGVDAWAMIPAEAERIKKYQAKGDVATLTELQEYLSWL